MFSDSEQSTLVFTIQKAQNPGISPQIGSDRTRFNVERLRQAMTGSSLFAGALLLALVRQSSATWQRLEQLERLDGNETCSMEDASLLNIGTSRAHNGRSGSKCQYCLCLTPDPVKCGKKMIKDAEKCGKEFIPDEVECGKKCVTDAIACGSDVVTSVEKCGEETVTSIAECGESVLEMCHTRRRRRFWTDLDITCDFSHVAKTCLRPKTCSVPKSCWKVNTCWVPKSCLLPVTCWLPVNFLDCADQILQELPEPLQPFWSKYLKGLCSGLSECAEKVTNGIKSVVEDAWHWMEKGFGNDFDGKADKIVGGVDSFKNMVDKLSIKDAVMPVMDELLEWRRKVENAIDKASHGPIKLANMEDGRLCPAGLGDKQIFGVFPTDCGLFEDGSIF